MSNTEERKCCGLCLDRLDWNDGGEYYCNNKNCLCHKPKTCRVCQPGNPCLEHCNGQTYNPSQESEGGHTTGGKILVIYSSPSHESWEDNYERLYETGILQNYGSVFKQGMKDFTRLLTD